MTIGTIRENINMSSSYSQILKDIEIGLEEGEKPVRNFLLDKFGIITKNVGGDIAGWDLEVLDIDDLYVKSLKRKAIPAKLLKKFKNKFGETFEIKRDKVSDRTGNFFFEVWSNISVHNPGCVNRSKADVIVIVRKKEFIFIDRGYFISWVIYNLYHNTEMSKKWKKKTCKRIKNAKMMSSKISPHVRGILVSISDIKEEACIETFKRED